MRMPILACVKALHPTPARTGLCTRSLEMGTAVPTIAYTSGPNETAPATSRRRDTSSHPIARIETGNRLPIIAYAPGPIER